MKFVKDRLIMLRKARGMTSWDVAVKLTLEGCGVTYSAVKAWERGAYAPTGARLRALAHLFDVSMERFFEPLEENEAGFQNGGQNEAQGKLPGVCDPA